MFVWTFEGIFLAIVVAGFAFIILCMFIATLLLQIKTFFRNHKKQLK